MYVDVGGICTTRVGNNKYKISFGKFQVWKAYIGGLVLKLIFGQSDIVVSIQLDKKTETAESFIIGTESVESKTLWNK